MTTAPMIKRPAANLAILGGLGLLVVQVAVIGLIYKHGIDFECRANWPGKVCSFASVAMVSVYSLLGTFALFTLLFRKPVATLLADAGENRRALLLNALGVAITLIPVTWMVEGAGARNLNLSLGLWTVGMALIGTGIALFLAPWRNWRPFLTTHGLSLIPLLMAALAAPLLARIIRPLWRVDEIAAATFSAVSWLVKALGYPVDSYPEYQVIGAGDFYIDVAPVCSGIEGIALVTVFVTLYLWLFRGQLRFPRALLLYPVGIMVSATLNVVRIVILLVIGLEGNAELAVGGFHSHAGWMMFTVIAFGLVAVANTVPWLQKYPVASTADTAASAPLPFFRDPVVARILPFLIFMVSAIFAQAFSQTPGVIYPLRAAVVAAALFAFWPIYARLPWRLDPLALAIGAAIGLAWILIPVDDPTTEPPYGALTGGLLLGWMVARGIGTTLLVPLLEELFFRDYLEGKLRRSDSTAWVIGAAIGSAVLFAALHGRWMEAFFAGLALSYLARRHGNITDAIVAHAVANGLIFAAALATGQMHII